MKEFYKAEVGSPLQKALVDNPEAQKQLMEVLDKYKIEVQQAYEEDVINRLKRIEKLLTI